MVYEGSIDTLEWIDLVNDNFTILFRHGYTQEAQKIMNFANYAREIVSKALPIDYQKNITVYIYECPLTVCGKKLDWHIMRSCVESDLIHLLSPVNAHQVSTEYNDVWYKANIIHEYVHHVVAHHMRVTSGIYRRDFLPDWFSEGIAGYIPYYHSSPEIMNRYQKKLEKQRERVRNGVGDFNALASKVYFGGPLLVEYIYDVYCESKVLALIGSRALNWEVAVEEELGITCRVFEANWLPWAIEHFRI